jgi:hypothetical protein
LGNISNCYPFFLRTNILNSIRAISIAARYILFFFPLSTTNCLRSFFPPKTIDNIGTFQDASPLENDPLLSALLETAATFLLAEEPDFVISLGIGEPKLKHNIISIDTSLSVRKNRVFPRLYRIFWEKMRNRKIRQVFRDYLRYYRLDIEFDQNEPRLDDIASMPKLRLIV